MMNIETQFDLEKKVRTHQISGEVNLPQFQEILKALYASPDFDPNMNALWDYRQADFKKVTQEDVRAFIQTVATYWSKNSGGKYRAAIVVAGMSEYSICRMYESQFGPNAPCKMKVFLDIDLAWKWFAASEEIVQAMTSRPLSS